jgi:hypothetical protein
VQRKITTKTILLISSCLVSIVHASEARASGTPARLLGHAVDLAATAAGLKKPAANALAEIQKLRKVHIDDNLDDEWNDANKISGTCITCCKYSNRITKENELCYRCFENWFYENK